MSITQCKIIELPKIADERGTLSFAENNKHVPFAIKRIFYLYDVPATKSRGAHAHKTLHQFIICLSGSLDVEIDDGQNKQRLHLDKPWQGLHIPPMTWTTLENLSPNAICLVLASDIYTEEDYYREYSDFQRAISKIS